MHNFVTSNRHISYLIALAGIIEYFLKRYSSASTGLALLILLQLFPFQASAQDLIFSSNQWGRVNLVIEQSSGAKNLESILGDNPNFELLGKYPENSVFRRLSRPVGRLDIRHPNGIETCTASLVAVDKIITNYHCIPGTGQHGAIIEASLLMGYYSETDSNRTKRYKVDIEPLDFSQMNDYAILRVEGRPGEFWGILAGQPLTPSPGEPLLIIHHPAGKPKHITRGGCRAGAPDSTEGIELFHECDTLPGSSGAPIFSNDTRQMLAIHYAGSPYRNGSYNFGKLLSGLKNTGSITTSTSSNTEANQTNPASNHRRATEISLKGKISVQSGFVFQGKPLVSLMWMTDKGSGDISFSESARLDGMRFEVTLDTIPPDDVMFVVEGVRLGIAALAVYDDRNSDGIGQMEELVGGAPQNMLTYLDGDLRSALSARGKEPETLTNLPQGYSLTRSVTPEERGKSRGFDDLLPVENQSIYLIVPKDRKDIKFPNWT